MESESGQSDITTIDPTKRIVKYFSKCLIELIKHAESIQFKNNKLVNYDVISTVNYDSDHEIDITEHNIKTEIKKEGPIFKHLERIQQCIVELLTICSQQNISIDYDTTKSHITIYDGFDDSQRILVMNHLTLNVLSIVENIYLSLKFFKYKNMDNGQHIKKAFSNIYKEIKLLPMRPDIIDNMDSSFKSLTHKSEYIDSYNYLVEKLSVLRKFISKFNKTYQKKCGYNDFVSTEDSADDDGSPRKKNRNKILEKTYIKPENDDLNGDKEQGSVFKKPVSIDNVNPNMDSTINSGETPKRKKRKKNDDATKPVNVTSKEQETVFRAAPESLENISATMTTNTKKNSNSDETPKKKKRKTSTNTDEKDTDICKSMENISANIDTTDKYSDETPKKKNRKKDTDTNKDEQESVLCEIPESLENISATIEASNAYSDETPKKNKRYINTDTDKKIKSESTENINENMDTKNIHSDETPKKKNRTTTADTDKEINSDNEEQESVLNISSDIDTTKKHKTNTDTEKEINDSAKLSDRELLLRELLNDTINKVNTDLETEKKSKKKKKKKSEHKTKNSLSQELNNSANSSNQKQNVNIESSNKESSFNECVNDKTDNKKKGENGNNKDLDNSTQNNDPNKKSPTNKKGNKISAKEKPKNLKKRKMQDENTKQIKKRKVGKHLKNTETVPTLNKSKENLSFDELYEEELNSFANHFLSETGNDDNSSIIEIDYDNTEFEEYRKIIQQNNLNEHERFLYIQDLVEVANAKVAITEEKKEKMRNLCILVDWKVCPAHLIASNITGGPNDEEKEELRKLGVTLGPFSKKEDEILRKNWEKFYQAHDLEDDPAPFMVMVVNKERLLSYDERKKFLQHMGRGLPHKSLFSIFRRFKCLFKPKVKTGRFSPEEDELILTYINKISRGNHRNKYVRLAPLINRDRWQIERRHRTLKGASEPSSKKTQWSLELKEKFLKHLLEETQSASVEDLRNKHIDLDMYTLIGKMMNIPPMKLKLHWKFYFYTELFAQEPINTDLIKIKLIKKFWELEYDDWKTIDWEPLTAMFDGITKSYLWITLKNAMRENSPPDMQDSLKDCIDYLHDNYIPMLETRCKESKSKFFPRLKYENGTLVQYE